MKMTRWITFHPNTAEALRGRVPPQSVFEFPGRNVREYALSSSGSLVTLLKGDENQCVIAVFRHTQSHEAPAAAKPPAVRAGGILGLVDEAVFEEEEAPTPKNWLRRMWGR
jgi:hypothetical protein